ncbi:hypothetical protein ALC60_12964 [Trachymyrmex zeteki]|uniref:Uncharacterized protein n=1 Tax=Mycetomoellerius zeteki TaxID=64791 RepID=A0A151WJJ7_9HYME|nr:hypothetical protein ALC60_12964 [Trachymyrmex zeteki]
MKSRGLSGVHLISECALDKHVWRTPDVDHLGNTSRLRFSNSYISTDKQPAVQRTFFLSVQQRLARICPAIHVACLASSSLKRVSTDFDFQDNSWQPDEQKYQKKYDRATDVSFLLLRPTADHPESCHHQGPEGRIPIPYGGIKIHVAGEGLIMIFNLAVHSYFRLTFIRDRANLRNSLIRVPFSRARRGRAYRAGEGLNRFVTDPLISHMRGSSQCKKDESESDFASWEIRRGSAGM